MNDQDTTGKIHKIAENKLQKMLNMDTGTLLSDKEMIFISLTLIAMLKYDSNFYDNVEITYEKLYSEYSKQRIEGLIRSILNKYSNSEDVDNYNQRKRKINVVLSNSVVPVYYLPAFFDFIYDIYKLNFKYSLPDDLY